MDTGVAVEEVRANLITHLSPYLKTGEKEKLIDLQNIGKVSSGFIEVLEDIGREFHNAGIRHEQAKLGFKLWALEGGGYFDRLKLQEGKGVPETLETEMGKEPAEPAPAEGKPGWSLEDVLRSYEKLDGSLLDVRQHKKISFANFFQQTAGFIAGMTSAWNRGAQTGAKSGFAVAAGLKLPYLAVNASLN